MNLYKNSLETVFSIAMCRRLQQKTLFLAIFDLHSLIVI